MDCGGFFVAIADVRFASKCRFFPFLRNILELAERGMWGRNLRSICFFRFLGTERCYVCYVSYPVPSPLNEGCVPTRLSPFHCNQKNFHTRIRIKTHLKPFLLGLFMSGFEIVGVVLGAFPLAIEGIKAYSNGMKTIKDIKHYQQNLRQFARELRVETCKYRNTMLELLKELVDPANMEKMMTDHRSNLWGDEHFRSQLKGRLRPADETLDVWLRVAKELMETLENVIEKFKLPQESSRVQKVCRSPPPYHAIGLILPVHPPSPPRGSEISGYENNKI